MANHTKLGHVCLSTGADLGGGCRGCAPPLPRDDLQFSNTTGILQKKKMWFIGVEVEQEMSAPPPEKNPGSAPVVTQHHLDILNIITWESLSTAERFLSLSKKSSILSCSLELLLNVTLFTSLAWTSSCSNFVKEACA